MKTLRSLLVVGLIGTALAALDAQQTQQSEQQDKPFRFRTGVELINVTATVTDATGRFVPGLRKEDFRIYQDEQPQQITHFNAERVPVSLGIVLDTSGSMDGAKIVAARRALDRFLYDLLGEDDEVFLYRFDSSPELVEGWTTDRRRLSDALRRVRPKGGTAMYDALAEAIPLAQSGRHRKKALLIISDGNDTSSRTAVEALKEQIRETEILVYAIGIDAQVPTEPVQWRRPWGGAFQALFQGRPIPLPFPRPRGPARPPTGLPPNGPTPRFPPVTPPARPPSAPPSTRVTRPSDDRVNVAALRMITDDSGGRTEVIRTAEDLDPATAGIADELSRQYYIGYSANTPKDGRWHSIRVEVRDGRYHVRARKGFVATP